MKKTQKELQDIHGKHYVEQFEKTQSPYHLSRLLPLIQTSPAFKVVDYGCGSGMLMPYVAPFSSSYTGVDFSEPFIKIANAKKIALQIKNASFECSGIEKFCNKHQNSFDVAFAMDFSEHVYDDEWYSILKSIKSSLKKGGILYIHTPNRNYFLEKMKEYNIVLKQIPGHVAVRTPDENLYLLKRAGFQITKTLLIPHYNILRFLHPFSYIPMIGKFLKARIFVEATV